MTTDTTLRLAEADERPAGSPYVGLRPFSEDEFALFFGRDRERKLVASNLVASRLTLLYGPSGVGKSSLLHAAVVPHLRKMARQHPGEDGTPTSAVVIFSSWRDEPVDRLLSAIAESLQPVLVMKGGGLPETEPSLLAATRAWTEQLDIDLLLILDQFEEYFLYHGRNRGSERFDDEFPKLVNDSELRVNVLLSLREDALAQLDRFKGQIPRLFGNYLRTGYLDREAARQAITGPITEYNRLAPEEAVEVEPALVEHVLHQVQAGKVVVGEAGAGKVDDTASDPTRVAIETAHLQLVMARLWEAERADGSGVLRANTLDRLGGATQIVSNHLDEQLAALPDAQRDMVSRVFEHLVTGSGTKIAHSAPDLADLAGVPEAELAPILEQLAAGGRRILRPVEPAPGQLHQRYEIFHDVLAAAVLDWRRRWLAEKGRLAADEVLQRERETALRARRRARKSVAISIVMAALLVAVVAFAWWAEEQGDLAKSRGFAASATSHLAVDPAVSVEEALRGLDSAYTPEAERALRQALADSHVRSVIPGHDDWVYTVAFNGAGDRVVTASKDRSAQLWEPQTGRRVGVLSGHTDQVVSAVFDPLGKTVVTASWDDTARTWDARSGEAVHVLEGHSDDLSSASFDEAGKRVLTTSFDGTARIWDTETGQELHVLRHESFVMSGVFGPKGTTIATASADGTARVWDTATGQELARQAPNKYGRLNAAAFSPDGTIVASAGEFGVAYLWRWDSEEEPTELVSASHQDILSISFDPQGTRVLTGGDKIAEVWNYEEPLSEQFPLQTLEGHYDWVNKAVFSPTELAVATASFDGTARVWDAATGAELAVLRGHPDLVFDVAFSPDGRFLATAGSDGTVRFWERPSSVVLAGHGDWVLGAEYSADGEWVLTASEDGTARVWDAASGRQEAELPGDIGHLHARFSSDGRRVVTVNRSAVLIWDWRDPSQPEAEMEPPNGVSEFQRGVFANDGSVFFVANGTAVYRWVWEERASPEEVVPEAESYDQGHFIVDLDVSPDGTRVVTTHLDGLARVRHLDDAKAEVVLAGHRGVAYGVRFSDDGKSVVTAGADGTARLWSVDDGREIGVLMAEGGLRAVAFSSDGDRVIAGSADGLTYIWDVDSGKNLARFRRHTDLINSVGFSPDRRFILTASDDRTAKIDTCGTCRPLEDLRHDARIYVDRLNLDQPGVPGDS